MPVSIYLSNTNIMIAVGTQKRVNKLIAETIDEGIIINGMITNQNGLEDIIKGLWSKYKLPKKDVKLCVDSSQFLLKPLNVPMLSEKKTLGIISREFSEVGTMPDPVFDYMTVNGTMNDNKTYDILAGAVDKGFIDPLSGLFSSLGIKLSSINSAAACVVKYALKSGLSKDKAAVISVLDAYSMLSVLIEDGMYIYSTRNRMFADRSTPGFMGEISQALSMIRQFHMTRRSEFVNLSVYTGGLLEDENVKLKEMMLPMEMSVEICETPKGMRLPDTASLSGAGKDIVGKGNFSDFVYVLGNLM